METSLLVRFYHPEHGVRVGLRDGLRDGSSDSASVADITGALGSIERFLQGSSGRVAAAIADVRAAAANAALRYPAALFDNAPAESLPHWLPPVDVQDVWASGVTYERSRAARQEEAADGGDVYARVYAAERPELFFKARGERIVGHLAQVGIRADATWNVPEPELAVVLNPALEVVGLTIGNDMSSRDIEGANPLYLPQAKVYTASCALGPGIVLGAQTHYPQTTIRVQVLRAGQAVFEGSVHTSAIHRPLAVLLDYLGRSNQFPAGAVLLTGTGIVPPAAFTLAVGDRVTITIDGIGTLQNTVRVV